MKSVTVSMVITTSDGWHTRVLQHLLLEDKVTVEGVEHEVQERPIAEAAARQTPTCRVRMHAPRVSPRTHPAATPPRRPARVEASTASISRRV